MYLGLGHTN